MRQLLIMFFLLALIFQGCSKKDTSQTHDNKVKLTLGAYTVPKEAYEKEIIPAFRKFWKDKTGQDVEFLESYIGSGAQSRAIAGGFEADIAALSLEEDITRLQDVGLITHDWKKTKYNGFVTRSVVVIAFRPGNPKDVKNWEDLARQDIAVLYPSPKTSGGAMWDINAIYGAGLKHSEVKKGNKDYAYARELLKSIQKRVKVMDTSGRASMTTFENGVGDALVTYENEVLLRKMQGRDFPFIIPEATILIENPIALVDTNVDKHHNRELAEAFIEFVYTKSAQDAFARYGFRAVDNEIIAKYGTQYPVPKYLFDINYLGGWRKVQNELYGTAGIWTKIVEELAREK